ncbi:MAG: CaiB/BaiF CoA-transferase family protein [Burkholderiales bacterium]
MGPLNGLRVLEFGAIGPVPFCGMTLADMGADVLRIDRPSAATDARGRSDPLGVLDRGKRSALIDLKHPRGAQAALRLVERADALIEGFRPGVMERLGLGPGPCLDRNPRLVYGRLTGWGQRGPLASAAGHDINFVAMTGALHATGERGRAPVPPLNLVGDFGGGGALLAQGVLAALWRAARSGHGQVVDAAMVDGAAQLMAWIYGEYAEGRWQDARGSNEGDGGRPYFRVFETGDRRHLAVGAIEPRFFAELRARIGLDDPALRDHTDPSTWAALDARLSAIFATRTRDEWCALFDGTDACVSPVLSLEEAPGHPHNRARGVFIEVDGVVQPAPAPRFDATPGAVRSPPPRPGAHTRGALAEWGVPDEEIDALSRLGAIA